MKRFITSLAIACTVLCASSSCEDFLDVKLSGVIDGDYANFFMDGREEHAAGVDAHHSSRWKICDSDKSLSNQFFRLIICVNTA